MAKITGKEGLRFRGPARVFDSEEAMLEVVGQDPQQLKVPPPPLSHTHTPSYPNARPPLPILFGLSTRPLILI